ncbi:GTP-binding protein 1 (Fragment) [Seminavis robusta]|uniref:Elongation factor Tu, chloroplastic n=1 Tax=Seminavis robusta TaxID=568900 RepID=A0A9N8EU71_9STRA
MVLVTPEARKAVLETMGCDHIRVAVVGNVDAGKSTMIGTIKTSTLDDGRGASRSKIMKHQHEIETGRTSCISQHLVGLSADGEVVASTNNESEIAQQSARVVSLMDLAGHEKYFKTTVRGLSMGMADYAVLMINSAQPPTVMTMHHLRLCAACGIPVIIVMTKVDSCPSQVLQHSKRKIVDILRSKEFNKRQYAIKSEKDVETVQDKLHSLTPMLSVSFVAGEGVDLLKSLLFALPKRRHHERKIQRPFEFLIEEVFHVKGIGCVLSGFVNAGEYRKGEPLYVGPMKDGSYAKVTVRSMHVAQTDVDYTYAGHSACFAISGLTKTQRTRLNRRKGFVCVTEKTVAAVRTLTADLVMLRGEPVTMTKGQFRATAHVLNVKACVKVSEIISSSSTVGNGSLVVLRPGDRARVQFQVVGPPVYVRKGMRIILRDGHVRAVGTILETGAGR